MIQDKWLYNGKPVPKDVLETAIRKWPIETENSIAKQYGYIVGRLEERSKDKKDEEDNSR